jgi:hypothetical protein
MTNSKGTYSCFCYLCVAHGESEHPYDFLQIRETSLSYNLGGTIYKKKLKLSSFLFYNFFHFSVRSEWLGSFTKMRSSEHATAHVEVIGQASADQKPKLNIFIHPSFCGFISGKSWDYKVRQTSSFEVNASISILVEIAQFRISHFPHGTVLKF